MYITSLQCNDDSIRVFNHVKVSLVRSGMFVWFIERARARGGRRPDLVAGSLRRTAFALVSIRLRSLERFFTPLALPVSTSLSLHLRLSPCAKP
jgi:hypothetical protein